MLSYHNDPRQVVAFSPPGRTGGLFMWRLNMTPVLEERPRMTNTAFKAWRARHDLTQRQAAECLGVALNTVKQWEAAIYPVSKPVELLCKIYDADARIFHLIATEKL